MKLQLDENTLNAYLTEAIRQELNEGNGNGYAGNMTYKVNFDALETPKKLGTLNWDAFLKSLGIEDMGLIPKDLRIGQSNGSGKEIDLDEWFENGMLGKLTKNLDNICRFFHIQEPNIEEKLRNSSERIKTNPYYKDLARGRFYGRDIGTLINLTTSKNKIFDQSMGGFLAALRTFGYSDEQIIEFIRESYDTKLNAAKIAKKWQNKKEQLAKVKARGRNEKRIERLQQEFDELDEIYTKQAPIELGFLNELGVFVPYDSKRETNRLKSLLEYAYANLDLEEKEDGQEDGKAPTPAPVPGQTGPQGGEEEPPTPLPGDDDFIGPVQPQPNPKDDENPSEQVTFPWETEITDEEAKKALEEYEAARRKREEERRRRKAEEEARKRAEQEKQAAQQNSNTKTSVEEPVTQQTTPQQAQQTKRVPVQSLSQISMSNPGITLSAPTGDIVRNSKELSYPENVARTMVKNAGLASKQDVISGNKTTEENAIKTIKQMVQNGEMTREEANNAIAKIKQTRKTVNTAIKKQ